MSEKTHPICKDCRSDDVAGDALVSYDKEKNDWVIDGILDGGFCNSCEETQKNFAWVPTTETSDEPTPT